MNSDFGTALINRLPWQATVALVVFLACAALYALKHIKRDKQGKMYWYSAAYEGSRKGYKDVMGGPRVGSVGEVREGHVS